MLFCLAFVLDRSVECFKRFFEKPQGMKIEIIDGIDELLPHFTFCAAKLYQQKKLHCSAIIRNKYEII